MAQSVWIVARLGFRVIRITRPANLIGRRLSLNVEGLVLIALRSIQIAARPDPIRFRLALNAVLLILSTTRLNLIARCSVVVSDRLTPRGGRLILCGTRLILRGAPLILKIRRLNLEIQPFVTRSGCSIPEPLRFR